MTQNRQKSSKTLEFSSLFLALNEQAQEQTLTMLQALAFAQTAADSRKDHRASSAKNMTVR